MEKATLLPDREGTEPDRESTEQNREGTGTDREGTETDREDADRVPLPERLDQELGKLGKPKENMEEWLESVVSGYDAANVPVHLWQADFDQDGLSNEWVTVLREEIRNQQSGEPDQRNAYGIFIAYRDGQFMLQSFRFPEESFGKANVEAVEDLTGDGKPEVVWVSHTGGAHTTVSRYTVSTWSDGRLESLEGSAEMANVSATKIVDGQLMITGGVIGSAGAGSWQREYTDTYSIVDRTIRRIDRVFADSPTPYHRLLDGLWAEALGHPERALQYYTEAAEMKASSYKGYDFITGSEWVEGDAYAEIEEFERIVKRFALLRKELLTRILKGEAPESACPSAKEAAGYDETWLPYLNAPAGYANPSWDKDSICSTVDELE